MKQRTFFIVLLSSVIILLTIAGGVFAWTLKSSPLSLALEKEGRKPLASEFIPKQSAVMISLLVNPDALENLTKWRVSPRKRSQTQRDIRQLETNLFNATGLDYQKEIKPWLGEEITLAVTSLDYDRNGDNGVQPGYLLALQTKKPELAKEFLQAVYSENALKGDSKFSFEQYKGVNIITAQKGKKSNTVFTSSAVIADFVLFANQPKILRQAINTLQVGSTLSLNSSDAYSKALETNTEPRLGLFYSNLPLLSAWLGNVATPENADILQTLTVSLSLHSDGLVAQTAFIDNNQLDTLAPILTEPVGALKYTPASDSIVSLAGVNLPQLWQKVQTELAENSPLQELINDALNRLDSNLGLNLTKEVFPWVQGEFSLAMVNTLQGDAPEWLFVAERQPEDLVVQGIARLDEIALQQGLSVGSLSLGDSKATVWSQLESSLDASSSVKTVVKGVHTTIDNYEVFATSVDALKSSLQQPTIIKTISPLQKAALALPQNNDGYVYLNWREFAPLLQQKYPLIRVAQLTIKPLLDHLNSLMLTSLGSKDGVRQATIYFNLSPLL